MSEEDQDTTTIRTLDLMGDLAGKLAAFGGPVGIGATSAAALLKTAAATMRNQRKSIDEILADVRRPRALKMPWDKKPADESLEDTKRERPSSKAPPK